MCYDVSFDSNIESIYNLLPNLVHDDQIKINFSAAMHIMGHTYGEHPIIYGNRETGLNHLKLMEWGCIPFYTKDEDAFKRQRATMLNARSERILQDRTSYWHKIRNRRCLIPVTGIYEHRYITGWKKKVPYYVRMKDEFITFIAGLYSVAELPDKETGEVKKRWTYTLITRPANHIMSLIHNDGDNKGRMPLFLTLELGEEWLSLDIDTNLERFQQILNYEMPSERLEYWPVYTVRSPKERPDGLAKNAPYVWEGEPALEEVQD